MGRETLLTLLVVLFGGLAMQPLALLRWPNPVAASPDVAERRAWLQLWLPIVPVLLVGAWMGGWALREPDPVRARFDHGMVIGASIPFAVLALRAAARAVWVLVREPVELPVCTTGWLRPRVFFSPHLARMLDEAQIDAALAHERAHARHRDPLRIWLAQLATDLQWPWPWAHRRFEAWLELLEHARDDEARRDGASGTDLASVVVATARQARLLSRPRPVGGWLRSEAALLGDSRSLAFRVERLLAPLPEEGHPANASVLGAPSALALLGLAACAAFALGALFGNDLLHPFFLWTWNV